MKVAVIGVGGMGKWFAKLFKDAGDEVLVHDIKAKRMKMVAEELGVEFGEAEDIARKSELVIVAVPISAAPETIEKIARVLGSRSLLVDICSVKEEIVDTMKELKTEAEMASIHPLFGPGASDLRGKDIIFVPVKVDRMYKKFKERISEMGANVVEMKADEHDKLMAVVQCLPHFSVLSFVLTLNSMKDFLVEDVKTPMFAHLLLASKAFLTRSPKLYGEIQVHNKYASIVRERMLEVCRSLDVALSAGDAGVVEKEFMELKKLFSRKEMEKAYKLLYELFERREER
ncbi:MAG: prephenate dehydrogenase/arogenate dehydrogenase family protein [Candidatus Hadarchaeales archaeon]